MSIEDEPPHNVCHDCGITFENSFSLVDHMLEDDEDFDPYFLLPNGHKLMLGSLLRFFYANAENQAYLIEIAKGLNAEEVK